MIAQAAHRLRLSLHARESRFVESVRLDNGYGHVAVKLRIVREVNTLTAALAEKAAYGVAIGGERRRKRGRR
jgi:hypothetical protein